MIVQNAGRNQMKDCPFPFDNKGVAGIVTSLEPGNHIGMLRIEINYLSFSFIPPLCSDDDDICHDDSLQYPTSPDK
jgi:hypothetical protein